VDIQHRTSGWMLAPAKLDLTLTYLHKHISIHAPEQPNWSANLCESYYSV